MEFDITRVDCICITDELDDPYANRTCIIKTALRRSKFSTGHSKAIPLLQFFFVRASMVSYVAFVLLLLVPNLG